MFKYLVRVSSRPELGFLGRIIRRKKFIKKKIKPGQQIEVRGERCLGTAAFIHVTLFAGLWPLDLAFIAFALTPPTPPA